MDINTPVKPIFEINTIGLNDEPRGCPICPNCKEPAYDKDKCVFCGQIFVTEKKKIDGWNSYWNDGSMDHEGDE